MTLTSLYLLRSLLFSLTDVYTFDITNTLCSSSSSSKAVPDTNHTFDITNTLYVVVVVVVRLFQTLITHLILQIHYVVVVVVVVRLSQTLITHLILQIHYVLVVVVVRLFQTLITHLILQIHYVVVVVVVRLSRH